MSVFMFAVFYRKTLRQNIEVRQWAFSQFQKHRNRLPIITQRLFLHVYCVEQALIQKQDNKKVILESEGDQANANLIIQSDLLAKGLPAHLLFMLEEADIE